MTKQSTRILLTGSVLAAGSFATENQGSVATSARRPNVLFIVSDDQRYDTIGALGNPQIHTPNLDRMVRDGFAFERNFCTAPICTPARAEILTGCNSFRNGVLWFGRPIRPELTLLPKAFQLAGFHTIHVGKWHNDEHPRDKSYDVVRRVFNADNLNDYAQHGQWQRYREKGLDVEGHSTELFTDAALEEIRSAPADRPWFCFVGYHAPHDPHDSPAPFNTMYDSATIPLFPNYMPEHPIDNGANTIRDELVENWPRTQDAMRRYRARYYGAISHMDHHIGRLLGQLRSRGMLDNTLVVFTGDQGLAAGSHGLLGKENMYDHSIASPLIFFGPGVPSGGRSAAMSHQMDLYPTVCELAGVPVPVSVEGFSLVPVMQGETNRVRDAVFCDFALPQVRGGPLVHVQLAVRTERWKLIWNAPARQYQLFDLERDADEVVNLLATWRRKLWAAQTAAGGNPDWGKDRWSAMEMKPVYTQQEIDEVAVGLWKKLLQRMDKEGTALSEVPRPPCPVDDAQY
jgi:arylsulfatase A-like enzyme